MPKYLGSRKLAVQLGEKKQVQFYWQESEEEYHSTCLSIGLFFIQNPEQLVWVDVVGKKAALFPGFSEVYSSLAYLSMSYQTQTFNLNLSPFRLYPIPFPPSAPPFPPIKSKFEDISEAWLPANSTFKFYHNQYDYQSDPYGKFIYGDIMFGEFEQLAKKLQDCTADCTSKYQLQARYYSYIFYSVCSIESAVIVTSMNRFYQRVDFSYKGNGYQGTVFVGISFRDQKDITVTSNQKLYK
jgi:hypothetical protein